MQCRKISVQNPLLSEVTENGHNTGLQRLQIQSQLSALYRKKYSLAKFHPTFHYERTKRIMKRLKPLYFLRIDILIQYNS